MAKKKKGEEKKPPKRVRVTFDPRAAAEARRAYEEQLRANPDFQKIVDSLVIVTAQHGLLPVARLEAVDDDLAAQCRGFAARLAFVGCNGLASPAEIVYARGMIERGWRFQPVYSPGPDGTLIPRIAEHAEPWHIALCTIFHLGRFAPGLVRTGTGRSDDQRAFDAVADILRDLRATCLPLPARIETAALAMRSVSNKSALSSPTLEHVEAAMLFVRSLAHVKKDGEIVFRIHSTKPRGQKMSPWRAGVEFAACFEEEIKERIHDAAG